VGEDTLLFLGEHEEEREDQELTELEDVEFDVRRRASKPLPPTPPPTLVLSPQSNLEPGPGAYLVRPGRSVMRATASLSSDASAGTAEGEDPAAPPQPPLPSLVEAEPVVSSVLVEATPVDGDMIPIPARWKHWRRRVGHDSKHITYSIYMAI
jgi:hypothetical protein